MPYYVLYMAFQPAHTDASVLLEALVRLSGVCRQCEHINTSYFISFFFIFHHLSYEVVVSSFEEEAEAEPADIQFYIFKTHNMSKSQKQNVFTNLKMSKKIKSSTFQKFCCLDAGDKFLCLNRGICYILSLASCHETDNFSSH